VGNGGGRGCRGEGLAARVMCGVGLCGGCRGGGLAARVMC
jgi:hypothetical protein